MSDGPIDLDTFRALQEEAGAEFVPELIEAFLEEAPTMLATLRSAMASGNTDAFRRAAHSLKSNSQTFGAQHLATLARDLEAKAVDLVKGGDGAVLEPALAEYARVAAALPELGRG